MNKMTFEEFCECMDAREKAKNISPYSADERKFLWEELKHKADDVREAVLNWVETGVVTDLSVEGLIVPKGYFGKQNQNRKMTLEFIMTNKKMNYIAAALTIDWLRREPRKALVVLRRGMI